MLILKKKTLQGSIKKILHNGVEIEYQIGYEFLKFINDTDLIVDFVKNTIDKYILFYNIFNKELPIYLANSTGTALPICLY